MKFELKRFISVFINNPIYMLFLLTKFVNAVLRRLLLSLRTYIIASTHFINTFPLSWISTAFLMCLQFHLNNKSINGEHIIHSLFIHCISFKKGIVHSQPFRACRERQNDGET